jgi:hypothetical protein
MSGLLHRLHIGARRRRLMAAAWNEPSTTERADVERLTRTCRDCRAEFTAHQRVSAALAREPRVRLSPDEAAGFRAGVQRRIDLGIPASPRPARRALRELMADHPRMSLASAVATVAVALGLTVLPMLDGNGGRARNGVEVLSIEVGEDTAVMVFDVPDRSAKIVWLFEKSAL